MENRYIIRKSSARAVRRGVVLAGVGTLMMALLSACAASGTPATWVLSNPEEVSASSTEITMAVMRVECANGVTGEVLAPLIQYDTEEIVITAQVKSNPEENYDCPSNDEVTVKVQLAEAIGGRKLLDGICLNEPQSSYAYCKPSAVRW